MGPININQEPLVLSNPRKEENTSPKRKLTRAERRVFQRKLKKPKYQKIAKRVIQEKNKK